MESTLAMQAVAPRVKELQAKYANDPETLQLETARMYKTAGVNPLAGCLPTLATIPVFIGLYRWVIFQKLFDIAPVTAIMHGHKVCVHWALQVRVCGSWVCAAAVTLSCCWAMPKPAPHFAVKESACFCVVTFCYEPETTITFICLQGAEQGSR
jgi:YidC/Oxa1 family membrane protein insertase